MRRGWLVLVSCALVSASLASHAARAGVDSTGDLDWVLGLAPAGPAALRAAASPGSPGTPGLPINMAANAAFSAALALAQEHSMTLVGDWDGAEDLTADHGGKVAELPDPTQGFVTRVAISEHTIANGFNEDIFYFGDSVGNVYVVSTTNVGFGATPSMFTINVPTLTNAFGTLNSDSHIVITGLAVSPVVDLTSFSNVNGSYSGFNGQIGEILYVSFLDTGGGLRLASGNQLVHSGLLAFPVADVATAMAPTPPGTIAPNGFPVTVGASFGVLFSTFANVGGIAVDDDGNVYFHQADLTGLTGGNIVKLTSTDQPGASGFQDRSLATSGFLTVTTLNPTNGVYGQASGPTKQVTKVTNYSGTAKLFGNIAALAAGPDDVLYAAVARSFVAGDDAATQATEGLFPAELGATPSMIISFTDTSGALDKCSAANSLSTGVLPIGDNIADVAQAGLTLQPGVNNFRVFVLGDGPDLRGPGSLYGTTADTLRIPGLQVDYSIFSGLAVDEENAVYVVSGGTPFGVGRNPSPDLGEVLVFPDRLPRDRRADFVDLRGDTPPNPPASGGNAGDGKSDRFDHIFVQAPLDALSFAPSGLAGIARGFLLYLNRPGSAPQVTNLPTNVQGDDTHAGPLLFDQFDPSHQVAGGDDQNAPFRGDDSDGGGSPAIAGGGNGGFEFSFGGISGVCTTPWNAFFLNSNGNVTFGTGDDQNVPTDALMISGFPRIAPAWSDQVPSARSSNAASFPVQALGFSGINAFKIRWIDSPQFGLVDCGSSNTFAVTLYDDGTGVDENSNQTLNAANPIGNNAVPFDLKEGPTDLRFLNGTGAPPRPDGSGQFRFDYGRMDMIGSTNDPVFAGYSIGTQGIPSSICHTDASAASRAFDGAGLASGLMGDGRQAFVFEKFTTGTEGQGGTAGVPSLDLRAEGNDPALSTAATQPTRNRDMVGFAGVGCGGTSTTCSCVIVSEPTALPAGAAGSAYSAALSGAGGTAPHTFAVTGPGLPPGLSLGSTGSLSGTPTIPGSFVFAVQVTDATGCSGVQNHTLDITGVAPPPPPAGCVLAATVDSITCRLHDLGTAVGAASDLGKIQGKLAKLVNKALSQTQAGAGGGRKGKKALGGAIRSLKTFYALLNSKKGRRSTAHVALIAAAHAIRSDMATLRATFSTHKPKKK